MTVDVDEVGLSKKEGLVREPYILVRNISKTYGPRLPAGKIDQSIFRDFSLEIYRHEFLTLFGPNGFGKTTLLKLIAGIDRIESGEITIGGKSPAEVKIGFVFQDFQNSLYPWKTNIDNIAFPLELQGEPRAVRRARARSFLEQFKIDIPESRYPYELSGGQKQLVAISRAILMEPDILILDEPFAHIDFETRLALQLKLMEFWASQKMTVLFVSHDIDEAAFLGDRIVILQGRPGIVRTVVDNPLPRPRRFSDLRSPDFVDIRSQILRSYGREILE